LERENKHKLIESKDKKIIKGKKMSGLGYKKKAVDAAGGDGAGASGGVLQDGSGAIRSSLNPEIVFTEAGTEAVTADMVVKGLILFRQDTTDACSLQLPSASELVAAAKAEKGTTLDFTVTPGQASFAFDGQKLTLLPGAGCSFYRPPGDSNESSSTLTVRSGGKYRIFFDDVTPGSETARILTLDVRVGVLDDTDAY
jgi:hypothetical protein